MYTNLNFNDPLWTPDKERLSLITAMILGKILNRIVILPKFSCYGCAEMHVRTRVDKSCAFNALYHVKSFDSHFSGQYREHAFLKHPKVPDTITGSISPKIKIPIKNKKDDGGSALGDTIMIKTKNKDRIFAGDITSWFGKGPLSDLAVLRFHSLDFDIHFENPSWLSIFDHALKRCNYRQDPRVSLKWKSKQPGILKNQLNSRP